MVYFIQKEINYHQPMQVCTKSIQIQIFPKIQKHTYPQVYKDELYRQINKM